METDGVLEQPAPSVYIEELGDDAVVVRVHYWIRDPRRRDIFRIWSTYARTVKSRLEDAGITISPPSGRDPGPDRDRRRRLTPQIPCAQTRFSSFPNPTVLASSSARSVAVSRSNSRTISPSSSSGSSSGSPPVGGVASSGRITCSPSGVR